MENEFDLKKWEVPELPAGRASELLARAKDTAVRRMSSRRRARIGAAALAFVAAAMVGYVTYVNSYSYKVAEVEGLLSRDVGDGTGFFMNGRDYKGHRERMDTHESSI